MVEGFIDYGFKYDDMPVLVYANYIENVAAPNNASDAYSIGFKLNKAKKPGIWEFGYQYHRTESDSVLSAISDGDPFGGVVGIKGHRFGLKYQLTKNIQTAVSFFDNDMLRGNNDYQKLQLDMIFKF